MGHEGRAEWYNTAVVVRKILDNFVNKEILVLTLVNKEWNFVGKSLLKARGNVIGTIGKCSATNPTQNLGPVPPTTLSEAPSEQRMLGVNACEDLVSFAKIIQGMNVIPFSGLHLNLSICHEGQCPNFLEDGIQCVEDVSLALSTVQSAVNLITDAVPITTLSIAVVKKPGDKTDRPQARCNAFRALEPILKYSANRLTQFSLSIDNTELRCLATEYFGFQLPALKIIKLHLGFIRGYPATPSELMFVKQIADKAPNLEQFHFLLKTDKDYMIVRYLEHVHGFLLAGSKAQLVLEEGFIHPGELSEDCLKRLAVGYFADWWHLCYEKWQLLLGNSLATLVDARLDVISLSLILLRIGKPFRNLRKLHVQLDLPLLELQHPTLLRAILSTNRWKLCFPNLKRLSITQPKGHIDPELLTKFVRQLELHNVPAAQGGADTGLKVEELMLEDNHLQLTLDHMAFLCKLCPHVKHLTAHVADETIAYFWNELPCLEEIKVNTTYVGNIDWILSGIFPDEVPELEGRHVNAEYLRAVNIVPVRPPITNAKALKKLTIICVDSLALGLCCFSKISGAICFKRMPGLTVRLEVASTEPNSPAKMNQDFEAMKRGFPEFTMEMEQFYRNF